MTAFETETVESCHSLGVDAADLFRPVSLVEIRLECARSSHSGRRASAKFSAWSGALAGATLACPSVRGPALDAIVRLMTRLPKRRIRITCVAVDVASARVHGLTFKA